MKRFCMVLTFVTSFCGSGTAQDLPPDSLADQYLLEATKAMEEGKPQKAIAAFQKIEALDIEPPLELLPVVASKLEEAKQPAGTAKRFTLPNGESMEFVWIPPGTFQMDSRLSSKKHEVIISKGFYLGKYEVTQGQWEAVMGTTPWRGEDFGGEDFVRSGSDYPAVYVSWHDAQEFMSRLNSAAGSEVYRLPSEAEWEYACRAGTTTRWSFGDDESQLKHYAWYGDNTCDVGECYPHRVGTKRANAWGLYDMHGNVWEWVQDMYSYNYLGGAPLIDPLGPQADSYMDPSNGRGGDFGAITLGVQSGSRADFVSDDRLENLGFRLMRRAD